MPGRAASEAAKRERDQWAYFVEAMAAGSTGSGLVWTP